MITILGGWTLFRKELADTFRSITQLGYGLVFICHAKEKPTEFKDKDGNTISSVFPDLNKTGLSIVNELVDVIAYLSSEFSADGESKRYLYTRQTPYVFAGSRYKYLAGKIEFSYDNLVNAITDAIEKEVAMGAETTDKTDLQFTSVEFSTVMEDAKELWGKLVNGTNGLENTEKIKKSILDNFGKDVKLSLLEPSSDNLSALTKVVEFMKTL